TFNLESLGSQRTGASALAERIQILTPQFERLDADVICLQEVDGQHVPDKDERELTALRQLLDGTRYASCEIVSTVGRTGEGVADVHNLVIVSRFPIQRSAEIRHDLVDAPRYRLSTAEPAENEPAEITWDRSILYATVTLDDGRPLHVVNLHLRAPRAAPIPGRKDSASVWNSVDGWAEGFFVAAIKRLGQALELRRLADRIFREDSAALIAVAGDFNAEDHEVPLRIAVGSEDDTGNGALAGYMLVPVDRMIAQDRRYTVTHHGRPLMLDHILVSRTLLGALRGVEVHNEILFDELIGPGRIEHPPGSFHAPLIAEFAL
ncbi:MAG TPA: endonuclease/exonuclease/phosphatase family protein, partial [Hyphomicrobiales bacterium]|nr:endonuclease/exonuclease/phosphatase family protein [Hyphomicrobiales bacterium]